MEEDRLAAAYEKFMKEAGETIERILDKVEARRKLNEAQGSTANAAPTEGDETMSIGNTKSASSVDARAGVEIHRGGTAVTVPEGMDLKDAIKFLEARQKEDDQVIAVMENIDAFPPDGAVALQKAIARIYGWAGLKPTPGFFGSTPPTFLSVQVSPTETVKVPWGRMELPGIKGFIQTSAWTTPDGSLGFQITGQVLQKHRKAIVELADLTRNIVATESIYRGRALRVDFSSDDTFSTLRFVDLSNTRPDELVLPEGTEQDVEACVFTPILRREECVAAGVPPKRGVLMTGRYGTGKTLIAKIAALYAEQSNTTFLLVNDVRHIARAVDLASRYAPAVVFAEDLDRAAGLERNAEVDAILNTIDGIAHKDAAIMVVMTTNHLEKINPAMLRPGRMDAVIEILPPDAEAVARLLRQYGRGTILASDGELRSVGEILAGQIPAVVREVAERAKLYSISSTAPGTPVVIGRDDLADAASAMIRQQKMVEPRPVDEVPTIDAAFSKLVHGVVGGVVRTQLQPHDASPVSIEEIKQAVVDK